MGLICGTALIFALWTYSPLLMTREALQLLPVGIWSASSVAVPLKDMRITRSACCSAGHDARDGHAGGHVPAGAVLCVPRVPAVQRGHRQLPGPQGHPHAAAGLHGQQHHLRSAGESVIVRGYLFGDEQELHTCPCVPRVCSSSSQQQQAARITCTPTGAAICFWPQLGRDGRGAGAGNWAVCGPGRDGVAAGPGKGTVRRRPRPCAHPPGGHPLATGVSHNTPLVQVHAWPCDADRSGDAGPYGVHFWLLVLHLAAAYGRPY